RDALAEGVDPVAAERQLLALDAGRGPVLAEHLAQRTGPLAGGDAGERALDRRLHHRGALARGGLEGLEGALDPLGVALRAGALEARDRVVHRGLVDGEDAAVLAAEQR